MKTAEQRSMEMMTIPIKDLPMLAQLYAKHLCDQVGMCMEVLLTAWTVYAQLVEHLPCTDDLYFPDSDAIAFFQAAKPKKIMKPLSDAVKQCIENEEQEYIALHHAKVCRNTIAARSHDEKVG